MGRRKLITSIETVGRCDYIIHGIAGTRHYIYFTQKEAKQMYCEYARERIKTGNVYPKGWFLPI